MLCLVCKKRLFGEVIFEVRSRFDVGVMWCFVLVAVKSGFEKPMLFTDDLLGLTVFLR